MKKNWNSFTHTLFSLIGTLLGCGKQDVNKDLEKH